MADEIPTITYFDGTSVGGDLLIRAVRVRGLTTKIGSDDAMMAELAASYLQGKALIWYEELTDEVQESWRLLRRELLKRWPPIENRSTSPNPSPGVFLDQVPGRSSLAPNFPTPAAAPPAASPVSRPDSDSLTPWNYPGRICVMGENNSRRGYISSILDESGHFDVTKRVEDAIDVRPRAMRHGFAFQISAGKHSGKNLGITWSWRKSQQQLKDHEATWAGITFIDSDGKSSSKAYNGLCGSNVWDISIDGRVTASWEISPDIRQFLTGVQGRTLNLTNDFRGFAKGVTNTLYNVSLTYERV